MLFPFPRIRSAPICDDEFFSLAGPHITSETQEDIVFFDLVRLNEIYSFRRWIPAACEPNFHVFHVSQYLSGGIKPPSCVPMDGAHKVALCADIKTVQVD